MFNQQFNQCPEQLQFAPTRDTNQRIEANIIMEPPVKQSRQRKEVTYHEAHQQLDHDRKNKLHQPFVPPQSENETQWNNQIQFKPTLFDQKLAKNEIFKLEHKFKKQTAEQIYSQPQKKPKQKKVKPISDKAQHKQKEIQKPQSLIDQENKIKEENEKQFKVQQETWPDALQLMMRNTQHRKSRPHDQLLEPEQEKRKSVGVYKQLTPVKDEQFQNELLDIQRRELKRQSELDAVLKQQKLMNYDQQKATEAQIKMNNKLEKIRKQINPLIEKLENKDNSALFPFTGNLLARSISKLIQVHHEQLTEKLIDDLLEETVLKLQEIEEQQQESYIDKQNQNALFDYIEAIKDIAVDQDQVESRFKQKSQIQQIEDKIVLKDQMIDPYLPIAQLGRDQKFYTNSMDKIRSIEVSSGFIIKVLEDRTIRSKQIYKSQFYDQKYLDEFDQVLYNQIQVTNEIIEECILERATHLWESSDQLAEQIFVKEFQ